MNTTNKTLLSLALATALAACGPSNPKPDADSKAQAPGADASAAQLAKPGEKIILNVRLTQAETKEISLDLIANGSVNAWQEAQIGPEVGGLRIASVKAQVGDSVRKGQVLASLVKDMVEADLEQAKASLAEAVALNETAKQEADRVRQLSNPGAFSAQQVSQVLSAEKTSQARVQSAQALVRQQTLRLQKTDIVAPDDGTVSASMATVGAVVQNGQELFRLIRQNRLEWRAEVTASEINRIQTGQRVRLQPDRGEAFESKVRTLAPTVDKVSRNALVYVDLPDALSRNIRAGQYLRGTFTVGQRKALVVQQEATVVRDGYTYVFVANQTPGGDSAKLVQTRVETGQRTGNLVEITSGLKGDEQIVESGASFLNDGDVVRVVSK